MTGPATTGPVYARQLRNEALNRFSINMAQATGSRVDGLITTADYLAVVADHRAALVAALDYADTFEGV